MSVYLKTELNSVFRGGVGTCLLCRDIGGCLPWATAMKKLDVDGIDDELVRLELKSRKARKPVNDSPHNINVPLNTVIRILMLAKRCTVERLLFLRVQLFHFLGRHVYCDY